MTPNNIDVTTPSSERELTDNELQAVQGGILFLAIAIVAAVSAVATTAVATGVSSKTRV